jgi:hypothetical protein
MEGFLILVGVYGGFILLSWVFYKISEHFDNKRREIRNKVYHELLDDEEINKEISYYKEALDFIGYKKRDITAEFVRNYYSRRQPKYFQHSIKCPDCKDGYLRARSGRYGNFFECSNYPTCQKKMNVQVAREQLKIANTQDFSEDFLRAYS